MPVEINELVVKAKVVESECNDESTNTDDTESTASQTALRQVEKAANEALEILNRKNER